MEIGFLGIDIARLYGKDCIVETFADNYAVRRLCYDGKRFVLVPLQAEEEVLSYDTVLSAAEIIWHRRVPQ